MATSVIGLKTHIWNNNLKSLLFLLAYPIIITPVYISVIAIAISAMTPEKKRFDLEFFDTLTKVVVNYWYIPYLIVFAYLVIVYFYHMNRLDVPEGKQLVKRETNPKLYELLENLCISRGFNTPYLFIRENNNVNAYTSGISEHTYYIVVTSGLLNTLNENEVEAVLAHELTHIINRDTRLIFITSLVSNMMSEIAGFFSIGTDISYRSRSREGGYLVLLYLVFKIASIGSLFAQFFISRKREYMADAGAVELTKNPEAMISALRKIGRSVNLLDRNPIRKQLYIHYVERSSWLQTHPTIEERVAAIEMFSRIDTTPIEEKAPIDEGYQPIVIPSDEPVKTADNTNPKDIW